MSYPRVPQPYGHQPQQPPQIAYVPPVSGRAIVAFLLAGFNVFFGWCLLGIPGLLGVFAAHQAMVDTRVGQRRGHGLAQAALFLGYPFGGLYLVVGVIALGNRVLGY
ncbi:hypothetical protein ACFQZ4_24230 [Catellatospora coxensis]|uniref:DUF4190 domain-containing protein n=1 Tax=Catellatospora coxensis TaxID=310354 RepID=A0A8J3KX03_9ACTN|nr:hypothetical protein [Catellatospora coxensis]GIG10223.1 hypothetical protein Cco03nite_69230 [Catellatospora coxensis]